MLFCLGMDFFLSYYRKKLHFCLTKINIEKRELGRKGTIAQSTDLGTGSHEARFILRHCVLLIDTNLKIEEAENEKRSPPYLFVIPNSEKPVFVLLLFYLLSAAMSTLRQHRVKIYVYYIRLSSFVDRCGY